MSQAKAYLKKARLESLTPAVQKKRNGDRGKNARGEKIVVQKKEKKKTVKPEKRKKK